MNLEHLSSRLKLDVSHLHWQARSQHLTPEQFQQRFQSIADGYCEMVDEDDLPQVKQLLNQYLQHPPRTLS